MDGTAAAIARKVLQRLRCMCFRRAAARTFSALELRKKAKRWQRRRALALHLLDIRPAGQGVRIRITHRPREHDVEGVSLDSLRPGSVCDVSAALGSWLIVQGYADPEMRRTQEDGALERRRTRSGLPDRRSK